MSRTRAQIRQPLDSRAQVSISVVDTRGVMLGIVRAPDAPIFGIDVSLQKARTAGFFSSAQARPPISTDAIPSADVQQFRPGDAQTSSTIPTALTGKTAFSDALDRQSLAAAISRRPGQRSQRPAVAADQPMESLLHRPAVGTDHHQSDPASRLCHRRRRHRHAARCTFIARCRRRARTGCRTASRSSPAACRSIAATCWSAAIGISGDGTSQDDMIGFLGLYNAGHGVGTIGEAPTADPRRPDRRRPGRRPSARLLYVNCPVAPFLDTTDQNVCRGK